MGSKRDSEGEIVYNFAPIDDIQELLSWNQDVQPIKLKAIMKDIPDLGYQSRFEEDSPRTMVVHDMKGGYHDDRLADGCSNSDGYRFYHWSSIDYFVYFSHHFVTIPPAGWTYAAHINGVPILGTFIVEHEKGSNVCSDIFSTIESVETIAQQLVNVAAFHKLQGWLVNIECKVEPSQVALVVLFLQKLTNGMKLVSHHSYVVWYECITNKGEVLYQNRLNDENSIFFSVCDAIYLNYFWEPWMLENTKNYAREFVAVNELGMSANTFINQEAPVEGAGAVQPAILNDWQKVSKRYLETVKNYNAYMKHKLSRPESGAETKVYVGIDVFGRGKVVAGKYDSYQAMNMIRENGLSAAIFAPGWTLEGEGNNPEDFYVNDTRLWNSLEPFLYQHGPTTWPVMTEFCDGTGIKKFENGNYKEDCRMYNLMKTSLLPKIGKGTDGCGIDHDRMNCFHGSGATIVTSMTGKPIISFWNGCDLIWLPSEDLVATVTYKIVPKQDESDFIRVVFLNSTLNESITRSGEVSVIIGFRKLEEASSVPPEISHQNHPNGWITSIVSKKNTQRHVIKDISISLNDDRQIFIGKLSMETKTV